ncbi:carbohydrate ABC transporter permease [Amphibacillus sp. Q70]|uniref:carbohydrate ABC transporter permease n=1 Tax=Amphibacillus sp. Q70 TaxID=3453416 RepID=UPI003F86971E
MQKIKKNLWFSVFTVPLLITFVTVVIIPFFVGFIYSFFQWDGVAANPKVFVGFDNFIRLFHDQRFLDSAWITIKFTFLALFSVNILGLGFALLVTSKLKTANMTRSLLFMPNLIGGLILGYIWQFIFSDVFSLLAEITGSDRIFFNWLLDREFALYAMVVVFAWQMAGYMMIIYIAGIQGIPDEIIEAAKIDGAGFWQRIKNIMIPLLMPAFTICIFLTLSFSFKIYDVNLSLTGGGPINSTELFAMNIYNEIFGYGNYGYGQAKAIVFFVLIAIVTLTQVYMTKKKEVEM